MKINLNQQVKVTLNADGARIWNTYWTGQEKIAGDVVKIQLHSMMSIFGTAMFPTMQPAINPTIEVVPDSGDTTEQRTLVRKVIDYGPDARGVERYEREEVIITWLCGEEPKHSCYMEHWGVLPKSRTP